GTPVNRIPIMAKQVLDLYTLYRLVTEKGGLVEVINKKIWREITKGLNLPTSITSAAFTLRTQYMKYLYPYECEKQALSSPGELQAAIDSNRREGRRQSFGAALFSYSPGRGIHPTGPQDAPGQRRGGRGPAPEPGPREGNAAAGPGHVNPTARRRCPATSLSPAPVVPEDGVLSAAVPSRIAIPVSLAGHHLAASPGACSPPCSRTCWPCPPSSPSTSRSATEVPWGAGDRGTYPLPNDRQETALNLSTSGISSINMSIEINGVVYTG
uniref:AT-rich interactive domain-containing protein 3 n=1 Tax=Pelodiscus sinensis TaxID=13735 RepID=K7G0I2_PELSI